MKSFPIPVVSVGAGSQPAEPEALQIAPFAPMEPIDRPIFPDISDAERFAPARAIVDALTEQAEEYVTTGKLARTPVLCHELDPGNRRLLAEVLGQGEVSIIISHPRRVEIQETSFAGVWIRRELDDTGAAFAEYAEVAPIPDCVPGAIDKSTVSELRWGPPPEGTMNGVSILKELRDLAPRYTPDKRPHVINCTLLPLSEADLAFVNQSLGTGPVLMLSRGYGKCRITATTIRNLWLVQYFNLMETMILNTIEITRVPEVALAAKDDISDAARRLEELSVWMSSETAMV